MAIRILHVVDSLGNGGLENGLVNLIKHLPSPRFEHIVCAVRRLGPNLERVTRDQAQVVCLDKDATSSRFQLVALIRVIREFRPDVVHSRNWGTVEAMAAGRWVRGCGLIHSEHGILDDALHREPWRRIAFRRLTYELADRVVSVSYQLRELQARRTGFPSRKITVIHNGVDTARFFPDPVARARMRAQLHLADDEFCIGCVGNLFPVKDHMTLLAAVEEMAPSSRPWRLLFIGEGPERSNLESFADSHSALRHRVQLLGSRQNIADWLRAMDLFVLPSLSEGISNALLEAMATGLPVLATATGGNPELVTEGESGLLFPVRGVRRLAELLQWLESDPGRRAQLGQAAFRRATECFSLEAMVRNYAELYAGVASRASFPQPVAAEV
jgi:sugar transferase (PEP-CTERM/EpsH1 system associated)